MDGERKMRGEDPPTQRERGQVESRGSRQGKGDTTEEEGGGGVCPLCLLSCTLFF